MTLAHVEALKARSDALLRVNPAQALAIAEVADLAASFCAHPLAQALAQWARANVLSYQGDYETCLALYQAAQAGYAQHGTAEEVARLQSNQVAVLNYLGRCEEALALAAQVRSHLEPLGPTRYLASLEMNAGFAHRYAGQYDAALAAYARSQAIWSALDNAVQVARVDINRANVLRDLDRFREAEELLSQAPAVLAAQGQTLDVARADLSWGLLAHRQGHDQAALTLLDQAHEGFATLENEMEQAVVDLHRAAVYADLNLWPEAQAAARRARRVLAHHGLARQVAQALRIEATVLWRSGELPAARGLLAAAHESFTRSGAVAEVALVDLDRAAVALAAGDRVAAQDRATVALAAFAAAGMTVHQAHAQLLLADVCLADGDLAAAAAGYQAVRETLGGLAVRDVLWHAAYGLGQVAERQGQLAAAAEHYEAALTHIEAWRGELLTDVLRVRFGEDKQTVYQATVRVALAQERWADAFDLVERSRSDPLLDWTTQTLASQPADEATQRLLDQLAELRAEWHWRQSALDPAAPVLDDPGDRDRPRRVAPVGIHAWEDLLALEARIGEAWRQLQARRPALVGVRLVLAPSEATARGCFYAPALPPDTRLVAYYAVDGALLAFVRGPDGVHVVRHLVPLDELADRVRRFRLAVESVKLFEAEATPADWVVMEADAAARSQALYQVLVAPLEPYLAGACRVVLMLHDVLHYLPFPALHDGRHYLLERFEMRVVPGVRWGQWLDQRAEAKSVGAALVLGTSLGGALPGVTRELAAVCEALAPALAVRAFAEDDATQDRLHDLAPDASLIHLACHGAFRTDNPLFSTLQLADSGLEVHSVYDLDLRRAALVTLSACETSVGSTCGGEVLGLSRALFCAGATAAVVSLWRVDDAATAYLMGAFYRHLMAGASLAAALRQAQEETQARWPHPFYWAPFVLVGADGVVKRKT